MTADTVASPATIYGLSFDWSGIFVAGEDGQVLWAAYMVNPNLYVVHAFGQTGRGQLMPHVAQQRGVARIVAGLWHGYRRVVALPITVGPSRADVRKAWFAHWRAWRRGVS